MNNLVKIAREGNRTLVLSGTHYIDEVVDVRSLHVDASKATIVCGENGMVLAGGNSSSPVNPTQQFYSVSGRGVSNPSLKVMGAKGQSISCERCDHLVLEANTDVERSRNYSIAYSKFDLGFINKITLSSVGGSNAWINENVFNLRRCSHFETLRDDQFPHVCNHNRVYGGTFEGHSEIRLYHARDCKFYDIRFEGFPVVIFGPESQRNTIINTWDSSESDHLRPNASVTDLGVDNAVLDSELVVKTRSQLGSVSILDPDHLVKGRIAGPTSHSVLVQSPLMSISAGDEFTGTTDGGKGYRFRIFFYDSQLKPLVPSTDWISSGQMQTLFYDLFISQGIGTSEAQASIQRAAIDGGAVYAVFKICGSWRQDELQTAKVASIHHVTNQATPFKS